MSRSLKVSMLLLLLGSNVITYWATTLRTTSRVVFTCHVTSLRHFQTEQPAMMDSMRDCLRKVDLATEIGLRRANPPWGILIGGLLFCSGLVLSCSRPRTQSAKNIQ